MSGTEAMRDALRDAADFIRDVHNGEWAGAEGRRANILGEINAALAQTEQRQEVPAEVMAALDRMCSPLHESRLSGVTAQEDARCMSVIREYVLRGASFAAPKPEEPKQHAPGLCLESGEFIPAEELNKARNQE